MSELSMDRLRFDEIHKIHEKESFKLWLQMYDKIQSLKSENEQMKLEIKFLVNYAHFQGNDFGEISTWEVIKEKYKL